MPPLDGPPEVWQAQPSEPGWPWNGATSAIVRLPASSSVNTTSSLFTRYSPSSSRVICTEPPLNHADFGWSSPGLPSA